MSGTPAVSVFTPTHNPKYLKDAWLSLLDQTFTDFEWVVVFNGACVPPDWINVNPDPRIKIERLPGGHGVGALKKYACSRCQGDLLVELDHDDWLHPDCLQKLVAARAATGAGFFYSDFVVALPGGGSHVYAAADGWETYPAVFGARKYTAHRAFAADARSLSQVWWAPNHVRAWTRAAYDLVGGHDPAMAVIDDHDLLCRTYLAGVPFCHVREALYAYRERPDDPVCPNTYRAKNAEVQHLSHRTGNRYFYALIEEQARRAGLPKVDLGGDPTRPHGYEVLAPAPPADRVWDPSDPLPFPDSSVGVVRAYDFLHRVPRERVVGLMNEIYRVLAPGGWLVSRTPAATGEGALGDPTARSHWTRHTFRFFSDRAFAGTAPEVACRFQDARVWVEHRDEWHRANNLPSVYADLVALKGQRVPGACKV